MEPLENVRMHSQTLEERLAQLEKRNRLLSFALAGMALCLGFSLLVGKTDASPSTVKATRFELVDASGEMVGLWESQKDGNRFILARPDGSQAVKLTAAPKVAGLMLFDENGKARASTLLDHQLPSFNLFDDKLEVLGSLGLTSTGAKLDLKDEKGAMRARVGVAGQESYFLIQDAAGKESWSQKAR